MKRICLCLLVFGALLTATVAQEELGDPALRAVVLTPTPPTSARRLIDGMADWSDYAVRDALLNDLQAWLHENEALPVARDLPRIVYASPRKMTALRYRALAVNEQNQSLNVSNGISPTTIAIYIDDERTIYLPDGFAAKTAGELSVLVHELVHHIQKSAGLRYDCPQAREKEAYLAQDRWLRQFGSSLSHEFEIDPFTVLVNSLCGY